MAKRRTAAERRQERDAADEREWPQFHARLGAANSFEEAKAVVENGPGPDQPGRRFYANLAFFIQTFDVPGTSTSRERRLYIELVRRLDLAGKLKPGAREHVESAFAKAPPYPF